jgi:hypothetical protein
MFRHVTIQIADILKEWGRRTSHFRNGRNGPEVVEGWCPRERGVAVSEKGTGQGSLVSLVLANVYLHYVFDLWPRIGDVTKPRAT